MRIMVLGCGEMGSSAVSQLIKYSDADVVAADVNLEKAKELAKRLDTDRVSARSVDVNDREGLVRAIKESDPDVVASCVGPFYKYAGKVYRAALEAGVSCVDICDDYAGTKEALALDEAAKKAEITIITGIGDSPSFTNIIAKYLANKLDQVEDINIFWMVSVVEGTGIAVIKHSFLTFNGPTHQYLDGKLVEVPGFSGKETVEFAPPVGKQEVMYCDHPEPFTLPLYIKDVKNVTCKGGNYPMDIPNPGMDVWTRVGLTSTDSIKVGKISVAPIDFLSAFLSDIARKTKEKGICPVFGGMRVEVKGEKGGDPARYVFTGVGTMVGGTPRALTTAAKLLARREIKVKGAYAPEGCIDPDLFIKEYSGGKLAFKEKEHVYRLEIGGKIS